METSFIISHIIFVTATIVFVSLFIGESRRFRQMQNAYINTLDELEKTQKKYIDTFDELDAIKYPKHHPATNTESAPDAAALPDNTEQKKQELEIPNLIPEFTDKEIMRLWLEVNKIIGICKPFYDIMKWRTFLHYFYFEVLDHIDGTNNRLGRATRRPQVYGKRIVVLYEKFILIDAALNTIHDTGEWHPLYPHFGRFYTILKDRALELLETHGAAARMHDIQE